jgi:ABC-2 type transport system permease protein
LDRFVEWASGAFDRLLPRRAAAIARKEARHIARDPYALGMTLALPFMMLLLFGYAISFDPHDVRVAVLDQDQSAASRRLRDELAGSGYFSLRDCPGDPEAALRSEGARAALVIPAGFQRALGRGERPPLQLILDGSDDTTAGMLETYLNGAIAAAGDQERRARGFAPVQASALLLRPRYLFNPELNSHWFIVPGLVVVILSLVCVLMTALTVAREWEQGSMELLLTTPARPVEIVLGKAAPYVFLGIFDLAVVYGAARLVFGVPFAGSHAVFLAGSALFILVALAQGLLISVAVRQQLLAFQMSMMSSLLPTMLLSGFIFPVAGMPAAFRALTWLLPPRWYMGVVRACFLTRASAGTLVVPFLALGLMAALLVGAAVRRFKTDLEP